MLRRGAPWTVIGLLGALLAFPASAPAPLVDVDLAVSVSDSPDPVTVGGDLEYRIVALNLGPSDAVNVTVSDAVPAGTTFVSSEGPSGWTKTNPPDGGTGTFTATNSNLADRSGAVFTLTVKAGTSGPFSDTATVTAANPDPNPSDNSDTELTNEPVPVPALALTTAPQPLAAARKKCKKRHAATVAKRCKRKR